MKNEEERSGLGFQGKGWIGSAKMSYLKKHHSTCLSSIIAKSSTAVYTLMFTTWPSSDKMVDSPH